MKKLLTGVLVLGVAAASQAGWTLLDNFDSYDNTTDDHTAIATAGSWNSVFNGTGNSRIYDTDQGQSLATIGGAAWRGGTKDITGTAGVAVGTTKTIFYQFKASSNGDAFDVMMGLSPSVGNIDTSNAWQDFNVMPFFSGAGDGTADFKATGPSGDVTLITDASLDAWYNVWLVVNNDATTPYYEVWTSTGTDDGTSAISDAVYRNTGALPVGQDLNAIGFMAAGGAGSLVLVDNIYYTSGVDTTYAIPEPATIGLIGIFGAGMLVVRRRFLI